MAIARCVLMLVKAAGGGGSRLCDAADAISIAIAIGFAAEGERRMRGEREKLGTDFRMKMREWKGASRRGIAVSDTGWSCQNWGENTTHNRL